MSVRERLYYAAPVAVQNAFVTAYGHYLRKMRLPTPELRSLIAQSRSWSALEVREYQNRQLRTILERASAVAYYRDLWSAERIAPEAIHDVGGLVHLPILSRESVRRVGATLMAPNVRPYWIQYTSGSTGTPLVIGVNQRTYQLVHALLERHETDCGVAPSDLRATFAGRMVQPADDLRPPFWRTNHAQRQVIFSAYHLSATTVPAYIDELARRQPAELIGYPSAIATVAAHVNETGQQGRIRPRVVVTNSETLFGWQRETIERAFGCPIRDYYGSAEAVVFAAQCEAGSYHFDPLLGIGEVVDEHGTPVKPGQAGRLVCSTLANDVMPLLRYEIGDSAVRLDGPCGCGSLLDGVREILGRQDDAITTPEGRIVGRIDHIFKGILGVRECQVVQEAADLVRLLLVVDGGFDSAQERTLVENTRVRLGTAVRIELVRVPYIPRSRSGKFRGVVTRLPNANPEPSGRPTL